MGLRGGLYFCVVTALAFMASVANAAEAEQAPEEGKTPAGQANDAKGLDFFEKKIRPVLVAQCYSCHSQEAGQTKGQLLLDTAGGMLRGGESGPAIVPGDPEGSLLIEAIRHESFAMPPSKKMPEAVIADFGTWIKMGAPDPRLGGAEPIRRQIDLVEDRKFWAFQLPVKAAPPAVKMADWPRTDVDRFLLAAMEQQGLQPVADAQRRTLLRRVYFDLIGLPPEPAAVDAFLADDSPQALAKVVDELLASPRFGERWARFWLDVARYADSNGNVDNSPFPHAWRYRDYVIDSLNADKPYDRFLQEQLAGDLLPYETASQRDEQLIATGFLALGSKPRPQNNPDFRMDVVADQIEVATSGLMALTVACARCHDHKFDPIPTSEYYSLAGVFTSTETLYGSSGAQNARVTGRLHELSGGDPKVQAERMKHQQAVQALEKEYRKLQLRGRTLLASDAKAAKKIKASTKKIPVPKNATKEQREEIKQINVDLQRIESELAVLQEKGGKSSALAMGAAEGRPANTELCIRGESTQLGEKVQRGFITVAGGDTAPPVPEDASGRLQLAQWITASDNPLTARVMVNRIWLHLFGRAIVPTVDNFGKLGELPSHPELLDYLAVEFQQEGWSIKRMIRSLVLSRAYGLSGDHQAANYEADPDNVFVWRHNARRLEAEAIRDSLLAVSGRLKFDRPKPLSNFTTNKNNQLAASSRPTAQEPQRTVYVPVFRNLLPEALELFDFADPSLVVGQRDVTTVPAQNLYLMNSPFVVQQAQKLAERAMTAASELEDRVNAAYRIALSREATTDEQHRALEFIQAMRSGGIDGNGKPEEIAERQAMTAFCQALLATAEFRYVD